MSKTPFQHVDAIYTDQSLNYFDELDERDKKSFNVFMVNRIISMNPLYIPLVNEFQLNGENVSGREAYLFYSQVIPKKKQFNKYIKANKNETHESWLIELMSTHFEISKQESSYYLKIFYMTDEGKDKLRDICSIYGIDSKKLKKAGL